MKMRAAEIVAFVASETLRCAKTSPLRGKAATSICRRAGQAATYKFAWPQRGGERKESRQTKRQDGSGRERKV